MRRGTTVAGAICSRSRRIFRRSARVARLIVKMPVLCTWHQVGSGGGPDTLLLAAFAVK